MKLNKASFTALSEREVKEIPEEEGPPEVHDELAEGNL